ncbi:hypothetical protein FOZ61_000465 [Perkinsus olseni]|uniref:Amino acid transporter transmembrane domain-containing protein n=1 Tax=Perkinsus olseni TaxID=32597 RepID=A0A7J6KSJ9_PEROL|nr:hypothetical protein FOZ61_000465 [Perkinsus olseni]
MKAAADSPSSKVHTVSSIGRPDGSSSFRTIVNFALVAIGVGILALPRAIAQGGWIVGSLLISVAWGVSQYAIFLLWKCMVMAPDGKEKFTSFPAIGRECFGRVGEVVVAVVLYADLLMVCSLLVILVGDGMHQLVPSVERIWWCLIFVGIMMPLAWMPTMKEVAFVSGLGIAAAFVTVIMVIVASSREVVDPVEETHYELFPSTPMLATLSFTNFMNAFTVAPVVPTLINDMRNPMAFARVSVVGFFLIFVIFAAIAFAGYAGFGRGLLDFPNVTFAIADGRSKTDWVVLTVQIAIEVVCFCHFLVMFNPVCIGVESAIQHVRGRSVPYWFKMISRSTLMIICFVVAVSVPGFGSLVDLGGSKLLRSAEFGLAVLSLCLALIGMVFGTWSAVVSWLTSQSASYTAGERKGAEWPEAFVVDLSPAANESPTSPKESGDRSLGRNLLGQAQAEFDRIVAESGKLRKLLAANQQASESQRATIGDLEIKLDEAQAEIEKLKKDGTSREVELRGSLSTAKSKLNELQGTIKQLKEELDAAREESESRGQACDQLGEQIAKLQAENKSSVAELASLREHSSKQGLPHSYGSSRTTGSSSAEDSCPTFRRPPSPSACTCTSPY